MALRDIFRFRELPESETTKPFLEHLEDLRWTIVKMAITLVIAMIICFAFRSFLVRVTQAPLYEVSSQIGTLKALGITDSIVISFHLAFYAGIVLSFPLLLYFLAEFVLPALTAVEKRFLLPAIFVSFALFLLGVCLLFLVIAENDSVFLSRHRVARLGANLDCAAVLFFCDAIHDRFWSRVRTASRGFGARAIRIDYLSIHGAHPAVRCRAHFYPGDDHHADAGHSNVDRDGSSHVFALRKLHLDCVAHGASPR